MIQVKWMRHCEPVKLCSLICRRALLRIRWQNILLLLSSFCNSFWEEIWKWASAGIKYKMPFPPVHKPINNQKCAMDSINMHTNAALLGVPCITLHERTLCACPLLPCALIGSFPILLSNCISQSESGLADLQITLSFTNANLKPTKTRSLCLFF